MSESNVSLATHEDEKNIQCQKVNQRRRSSFFNKRSVLTITQDDSDISEAIKVCNDEDEESRATTSNGQHDKENVESKENCQEEPFDMQAYIAKLKAERKSWIETLNERKRRTRTIAKQKSTSQRRERDPDLSSLTESERSFLLARPNYEQICENVGKLTDMAIKTVVLHDHVTKLHENFMSRAQDNIDSFTLRIIKMSD